MSKNQEFNLAPAAEACSRLGLGTGTLASLGRAASLETVNGLLDAMMDCDAHLIDTADSYASGDCEILLGKALSGRRSSFQIVTKAGYPLSNLKGPLRPLNQFIKKAIHRLGRGQDFRTEYLSRCLDDSLARLRTERVDAFLLHDAPLATVADPEIHELLRGLKQSGKTGQIGLSSDKPEIIRAAISSGVFDLIQTPANPLSASELMAVWGECDAHGIRLIGNHVFSAATLSLPGVSREQIMRACASLMPASATILCGTRSPSHFTETCQWAGNPLSTEDARSFVAECLRLTPPPST